MSICQTEIFMNLRLQKTNQTLENKWWPLCHQYFSNFFPLQNEISVPCTGEGSFQVPMCWWMRTGDLALGTQKHGRGRRSTLLLHRKITQDILLHSQQYLWFLFLSTWALQSICCKFPYCHYTFFHLFHVAPYLSCPLISAKSMGRGLGLLLPPLFAQQLIMADCGFRLSPGICHCNFFSHSKFYA
jgi:hypothetical protein